MTTGILKWLGGAVALLVLAGCSGVDAAGEADGGGADADAGASAVETGAPAVSDDAGRGEDASSAVAGSFHVGGTVVGLLGTGLELEDNGGDVVPVAANGAFTFARTVASGESYDVTVRTRPEQPSQLCTVSHGAGTMGAADVTDVTVTCSVSSGAVGGKVTGLLGTGLVLRNDGGDDLKVGANGAFKFATPVASGAPFEVTVQAQPANPWQTCTVTGGKGTVGTGDVTSVAVDCATSSYTIGGTVSGLAGTLVLQNEGGNDLTVSANGPFTFGTPVASGAPFAVTVKTQPGAPSQTCTVTNGAGTVANANVLVNVTCATNTFTLGGTTAGVGGQVVLQNTNNSETVVVTTGSNQTFTFATPLPSGAAYSVKIISQPGAFTCYLANGAGTIGAANVTNLVVTCPAHDSWTQVASMPTARFGTAAAVGGDGRVYVMGGSGGATVEAYSPATDSWATAASMPTGRYYLSAAAASDGRIYAVGGFNNGPVPTMEVYAPSTNTWTKLRDMPVTLLAGTVAAQGGDGRIYVIGAADAGGGQITGYVYAYTPSTNSWAPVGSMRTARSSMGGAMGPDGRIYTAGGSTATASTGAFESYEISTNTWATDPTLPTGGEVPAVGVTGNRLLVMGYDGTSSVIAYVAGAISLGRAASMPVALISMSAASLPDGRVLVFGGETTAQVPRSSVYAYRP